jgi:glycosyltransferase involved in cell wall biosynthesis
VVAVTEPITRDLRERLGVDAVTITNGFDPDDEVAPEADGLVRPDRFTIAYTGRLGGAGRKPQALLEAALELRRRRPGMARPPEVVFAGAVAESEQHLFSDSRYASVARSVGVLERPRVLALQRAADALVVIAAGTATDSVATGKLFEYLGALRPVLVLGEQTEAARIVARARAGVAASERDPPWLTRSNACSIHHLPPTQTRSRHTPGRRSR